MRSGAGFSIPVEAERSGESLKAGSDDGQRGDGGGFSAHDARAERCGAPAIGIEERFFRGRPPAFRIAQAIACAESRAFLISPYVGRILDWHVKAGGGPYAAEADPGVQSVRAIYAYYKTYGVSTLVMGASFRNAGEIEALAGCDRLTISPQLLDELAKDKGILKRAMSPDAPGPAPARVAMDEKRFRWMLNEDAMATEKLAEGIRTFAKDLAALREFMERRLALAA